MTEHVASRTLVKSPPELWAECSDAASLARHLDGFGEIRITRLEPETAVAWEGERARGTVRIEPSGWGTKVILTAVAEPAGAVEVAEAPGVVEAARWLTRRMSLESPRRPERGQAPGVEPGAWGGRGRVAGVVEVESPERETAEATDEVAEEQEPEEPEPATDQPPARRRRFARWFAFLRAPEPVTAESSEPAESPELDPELPQAELAPPADLTDAGAPARARARA